MLFTFTLTTDSLDINEVPNLEALYTHYREYGESVENKEAFHWFAYTILPCVSARVINFAGRKLREQISDVMSVSDEAFALLTLKNYEERWRLQAEYAHIEDVTERKSL